MTHHPSRFRVLHVVASTDRRGAEIAAVELANALDPLGVWGDLVALVPGAAGGLDLPVLGPSRYAAATLRRLRARAADASIVVAHGSSTLLAAAVATLGTGTPFVYRSIGDPQAWLTTPGRRRRVGLAARRAGGLVALWRQAAVTWHQVGGIRPERISVIPNGVSAQRFSPPDGRRRADARRRLGLEPDSAVVMYLGALNSEKRTDLAIQAIDGMSGVMLVVVGEGPERGRLETMAARSRSRIRFCGATPEPWEALAAADALVIPSDTEGQPAVAIEAGLMGIPVVGTRVGGMPEVVLDGRTGILVDRGDTSALAAALRRVLDSPKPYGSAAREHCLATFELAHVAESWSLLLETIIKSVPPR